MIFDDKIFISYSSYRIGEAEVVRTFFENNNFKVIMDKKEDENFIHFMDRISECKYVIMILNNTFFESPYCIYEVIKSFSEHKKIFPIYTNMLEIEDKEERKNYYYKLKLRTQILAMHLENSISGSYSVVNVQLLYSLQLSSQHHWKCIHKCLHQFADFLI